MGIREAGEAFQKFCMVKGICLQGVADIKNINLGVTTEYGNRIVSTGYILESKGLNIASNKKIYEYLMETEIKLHVLNLEELCPI